MITRVFFCFLTFLTIMSSSYGSIWDQVLSPWKGKSTICEPPSVRILLIHDVPGVDLAVQGQYSLYDPYYKELKGNDQYLNTRYKGKSRYMEAIGSGLKWGEVFPSQHQLKIVHDKPESMTLIEGKAYKGDIYVYDINGTSISIVNQIPIEEFVASLLNAQSVQEFEPEVLNALAIIARTNGVYTSRHPKNKYWDVDANAINYSGLLPPNEIVNHAVRATWNMIISKTGVYERVLTPFLVQFDQLPLGSSSKETISSKITLEEANEMAKRGDHAAQILAKAFPGSSVMLLTCEK